MTTNDWTDIMDLLDPESLREIVSFFDLAYDGVFDLRRDCSLLNEISSLNNFDKQHYEVFLRIGLVEVSDVVLIQYYPKETTEITPKSNW